MSSDYGRICQSKLRRYSESTLPCSDHRRHLQGVAQMMWQLVLWFVSRRLESYSLNLSVLSCFLQIRDVFECHFENLWFGCFGFPKTGRSLIHSHTYLFFLTGLHIQTLSMGSSPDGSIKQTQRILEAFHVMCQVGITLLIDVAQTICCHMTFKSQWRWLYVPNLSVYSRLLGWWCAWGWARWLMGGDRARNRRLGRKKHLDSDLLLTSHFEEGEALRRLLLFLRVGAHLGVK